MSARDASRAASPPAPLRACGHCRPAGTPRPRRPRTTRSPPARAAAGAAASTCRSTAARRGAGRAPRSRARPRGGTRRARSTPPRTPPSPRRSRWRPRGAPPGTRRARAGLPLLPAASSRHHRCSPSSCAPPPAWSPCPWLLAFLPSLALPCVAPCFASGAGDSRRSGEEAWGVVASSWFVAWGGGRWLGRPGGVD